MNFKKLEYFILYFLKLNQINIELNRKKKDYL